MAAKTADWCDELWARHAGLFDGSAPFSSRIGTLADGWRETVETLCRRLTDAVAGETGGHLRITRMENDRGAMVMDWTAAAQRPEFETEIGEIVSRAMARTACTCE